MAKPKIYKGTEAVRIDIETLNLVRNAIPNIKNGNDVRKYYSITTFLTVAARRLLAAEGYEFSKGKK